MQGSSNSWRLLSAGLNNLQLLYFHYIVAINKYKMNLQKTPGRLAQNKCVCVIETFELGDFVNYLLIKSLQN